MEKKPKGFVKRRVGITGGEVKFKDAPTFFHYQRYDFLMLNPYKNFYDRSRIISVFGSIEAWEEWRKEEVEIHNKTVKKNREKRVNASENAYKIPEFAGYDEVSPTYTIGEDGIARQRKD
ncbi:hypothetical protein [Peribacillus tepidiphilus]|uniref:hypothetical protein n=1 Tax=Peribacillus tepidiphilus TaxID=2652445 RepID=UPI0012921E45|nr:hypothetical protein [Peribacillus tepidiphilus]